MAGGEEPERAADGGAVPEGELWAASAGSTGAALRESVPLLRDKSVRPASLDLLAELEEPEQLIQELKRIADLSPHSQRWSIVAKLCRQAIEAFEVLHRPREP